MQGGFFESSCDLVDAVCSVDQLLDPIFANDADKVQTRLMRIFFSLENLKRFFFVKGNGGWERNRSVNTDFTSKGRRI